MYCRVDKGHLIFQIFGKKTQSSLVNLLRRSYVDKSKRNIIADLDVYTRGKAGKEIGRWLLASKGSYMHARSDKEGTRASPREIVNLILHASLYLLEGDTHIRRLRGHGYGGEGILFYLGQTQRPEARTCISFMCKAGGVMFIYVLGKVCLRTGLLPIEPKTRRSRKLISKDST